MPDSRQRLLAVLRYTRIAWTVACGILCLLLIALWVRSYWWQDTLVRNSSNTRRVEIYAVDGAFRVLNYDGAVDAYSVPAPLGWSRHSLYIGSKPPAPSGMPFKPVERSPLANVFRGFDLSENFLWQVPMWFCVGLSGALAGMPWIVVRYSLRTLLIAMTLLAVLLGAFAIWAR